MGKRSKPVDIQLNIVELKKLIAIAESADHGIVGLSFEQTGIGNKVIAHPRIHGYGNDNNVWGESVDVSDYSSW